MPFVTVIDPFELNKKKMAILNEITTVLFEHFPNYQICHPSLYIGKTIYCRGEAVIKTDGDNNITRVDFGILSPELKDNRKKFLGISFEDKPEPVIIGSIHIEFKETKAEIHKTNISVFGSDNKLDLLRFSKEFDSGRLCHLSGLIYLQVESENPKYLS